MTPPRVVNEWDIEVCDAESGDILDHLFQGPGSPFPGLPDSLPNVDGEINVIVLVHDIWIDGDLADRSWAYLRADGTLPESFGYPSAGGTYDETGPLVPKKYHEQIAKWKRVQVKSDIMTAEKADERMVRRAHS